LIPLHGWHGWNCTVGTVGSQVSDPSIRSAGSQVSVTPRTGPDGTLPVRFPGILRYCPADNLKYHGQLFRTSGTYSRRVRNVTEFLHFLDRGGQITSHNKMKIEGCLTFHNLMFISWFIRLIHICESCHTCVPSHMSVRHGAHMCLRRESRLLHICDVTHV